MYNYLRICWKVELSCVYLASQTRTVKIILSFMSPLNIECSVTFIQLKSGSVCMHSFQKFLLYPLNILLCLCRLRIKKVLLILMKF